MASVEQVNTMIELLKEQQLQAARQLEAIMELAKVQHREAGGRPGPAQAIEENNTKGKLKSKAFIGVNKLEKKEQWDEWAWSMKYRVKADNPEFGKILDEVEQLDEKGMEEKGDRLVGTDSEIRSAELYGILSEKVAGEAMTTVRATKEGDGLAAWRNLYISFNPKTLFRNAHEDYGSGAPQ